MSSTRYTFANPRIVDAMELHIDVIDVDTGNTQLLVEDLLIEDTLQQATKRAIDKFMGTRRAQLYGQAALKVGIPNADK